MSINKNKLGYVCLFIALLSFLISAGLNYEKFDIPYFKGLFTPIAVNIELPSEIQKSIKVNGEDFSEPANLSKKVIVSKNLNKKTEKLELSATNKDIFKQVSSVDVFIGQKYYHFNNLNSTDKTTLSLEIPHKGKYLNYKGSLNAIIVTFLALFYNIKIFIISWIFLILGLIFLEDSIKFNSRFLLAGIGTIAIFCRLNQLTTYPLWWDEIFVINLPSSHIYPWNSIFLDPANPSFFYLLVKIYTLFAPTTIEFIRLLPCALGLLGVLGIYFLTKKFANKNIGLLATFIASVSIYHICYAQELRGYSLILFIVPFVVISLFDLLKVFNKKNALKFILTSSIMINAHLFGLFLLLTNYIYVIARFFKSKEPFSKIFLFTFYNVIIFLTLVPYLLLNFLQTLTGRVGFNSHLEPTTVELILKMLSSNFGSLSILLLFASISIIYLLKNKDSSEEKNFVVYGLFTLIGVWAVAIATSFARPLLTEYYFLVLYPIFIATFAVIIHNLYKNYPNKIAKFALLGIIVLMISSQGYNNSFKVNNSFENVVSLVNAQAKDNPTQKYYLQITPKRIRDYYTFEKNVITDNIEDLSIKNFYFIDNRAINIPKRLDNSQLQVISTSFSSDGLYIIKISN